MVRRKIRQMGLLLVFAWVGLCAMPNWSVKAQPLSVQEQLEQSVGARYILAKQLARQGKQKQAIQALKKLLVEVEDGPAAVPIRRMLAKLYLKQKQTKKAKRTLQVASGPAKKPLAQTYKRTFAKYLLVQLKFRLQSQQGGSKSTKSRRHSFVMSRTKSVTKKFSIASGSASVNATLQQSAKGGLSLRGTFTVGGKKRTFQAGPFRWKGEQTREQRASRVRLQVNSSMLEVKLNAMLQNKLGKGPSWGMKGTPPPPRPSKVKRRKRSSYRFSMKLRNASMKSVLKILGNMSGYKITYKGDTNLKRTVSLKIKAKLRKNLIKLTCDRMGLKCVVKDGRLNITIPPNKLKVPVSPTPPPVPRGSRNVPTPPTPPRQ